MAKRKLATPADLCAAGVDYIAFHRVHNRETGERGYRYLARGECPESVKSALAWAKNVTFGTAAYRYAPELKYYTIVLRDHCIKGATK